MSITNLLAQGFNPLPSEIQQNALMAGQQMRDARQRNALMAMQLEDAQLKRAEAQRNALMLQQWRDGLQVPQETRTQIPGAPAMNAAQAESAAGLPGYGASSAVPSVQVNRPDPKLVQAVQMAKMGQLSPADLFKVQNPEPMKLGKDDRLLMPGPGGSFRELVGAAPKEDTPTTDWKDYQKAVSQGYRGQFIDYQREMANLKAPKTSIDMRQPNAFNAAQGKEFSDLMGNINRESFAAPAQIRKLERMVQLLEGVDGGKLAPLGLELASGANSLGIKIDPKLGNKEAAQALAREIAGGFRQPGTGPMTDKDFENFLLQVPDLSKTAEGRKQITQTMRNAANRNIKLGQLARAYVAKKGQLDNGFLEEAAQFIAENPVVGDIQGWRIER